MCLSLLDCTNSGQKTIILGLVQTRSDSYEGKEENKWVDIPRKKPAINYKRMMGMDRAARALESSGIKEEMRDDK